MKSCGIFNRGNWPNAKNKRSNFYVQPRIQIFRKNEKQKETVSSFKNGISNFHLFHSFHN